MVPKYTLGLAAAVALLTASGNMTMHAESGRRYPSPSRDQKTVGNQGYLQLRKGKYAQGGSRVRY